MYTANFKETQKPQNLLISYKRQFGEHIISLQDDTKKVTALVIDMNGREVKKYLLDSTQPIVIIDVPFGYYTLMVTNGKLKQEIPILIN